MMDKYLVASMATYYVYDVGYSKAHAGILQLIQEVLMEISDDKGRMHKSLTYRTVVSELTSKI